MSPPPSSTSSSSTQSAAHIVLAIPELLKIIFSFGTQASNASYALVCRDWREPALDNVWREVDDMYYLLQLLVPFKLCPSFDKWHQRNRDDILVNFCMRAAVRRHLLKHRSLSGVFPHSNPRGLDAFHPLRSPCAFSQVWDQGQ